MHTSEGWSKTYPLWGGVYKCPHPSSGSQSYWDFLVTPLLGGIFCAYMVWEYGAHTTNEVQTAGTAETSQPTL